MRRATAPAIWTISMSPSSVSKCQTTRSLFSLSLLNAGTKPPGMCSTDVTVPASGARLTWTFSGLMKIATRVRPSFHGMMLCTTPSAGRDDPALGDLALGVAEEPQHARRERGGGHGDGRGRRRSGGRGRG